MGFSEFMNDTGTLNQVAKDGAGDWSISASYEDIACDVQFINKRIYGKQNEEVTTSALVTLSPISLDETGEFEFVYKNSTYQVEKLSPIKVFGTSKLSHYEVYLR